MKLLLKQYLHSANDVDRMISDKQNLIVKQPFKILFVTLTARNLSFKKYLGQNGILFQLESLFVLLILFLFILALTNIDFSNSNTKLLNYYKAQDVFTLSVAKQLSQNEIKDLINTYLPNAEIVFDNSETTKKECYSRNLQIWQGYPASKQIIFVKICF